MTIEEAKEEIPTIESFLHFSCDCCTANDWYCPSYCLDLEKAQKIPFEKIQQAYAKYDGDPVKLCSYIKKYC
jgi:hypothetical protein